MHGVYRGGEDSVLQVERQAITPCEVIIALPILLGVAATVYAVGSAFFAVGLVVATIGCVCTAFNLIGTFFKNIKNFGDESFKEEMKAAYKQFTISIKLVGFATVGVICPFLAPIFLVRFLQSDAATRRRMEQHESEGIDGVQEIDEVIEQRMEQHESDRIDGVQERALQRAPYIQKHLLSAHEDLKQYLDLESLLEEDADPCMDMVYCDCALQLMLFKAIITQDDAQIKRDAKFSGSSDEDFNKIHQIISPLNQEEKEIAYRHLVITYLEELCGKQAKIQKGKQDQYTREKNGIKSPVSAHTDMIKQSLQRLAGDLATNNRPLHAKLTQMSYPV